MQGYINRIIQTEIQERLNNFPAVAVLGPRQCGKTTLALEIVKGRKNAVYLDLEKPSDQRKLEDPELFFQLQKENLICLDEIQRRPELFPVLRSIIDERGSNGQILILGSTSRDMIRQSSETLAGRIAYIELTPFMFSEIPVKDRKDPAEIMKLWFRGGFPRSFLAGSEKASFTWRENFIRTFLERDIPQLGFSIPAQSLGRLWQMLAYIHGQVLNSSKLGESMGVSHTTVRKYLDLLSQTFMVRALPPFEANLKKRLVKSPKVFIRDSGILHSLLGINKADDLLGHPVYGASWEGFAMENILSQLPGWQAAFFRTSAGAEIDLVLTKGRKKIACEFKASTAPQVTRGFWNALDDLKISEAWIIGPVKEAYPIKK
ncbi:MAG: ATP-binding protein, partial [Proteobacteria bacterium]|nr:ATP-binding protein [Pseudomonadota bacterium]